MKEERVSLYIDDVACEIACLRRSGTRKSVLFIHGFGSTKEDFADAVLQPEFDGRGVIAFDAPGCGDSTCTDLTALSMPFMEKIVRHLVTHFGLSDFHLVGHSMGGLAGLLYASQNSAQLASFTSIEGNLTPADCFLSRQIFDYPHTPDDGFLDFFIDRILNEERHSLRLYALALKHKVRPQAVPPIFRSIVEQSENADLLDKFLALPCATMFMHGDANTLLAYLPQLKDHGVRIAEIARCGHFPMYANPVAMWARLGDFFDQTDAGATL